MSNCTLLESGANENYTPDAFENTGNIKFYHNNVPRFGYSNDVMYVLQDAPEQGLEYIQGLLASPIALAVFIMTWIIILWVFNCCRCCCCRDYAWLAGKPVSLPQVPPSRGDDSDEEEIDVEKNSSDGPKVGLSAFKENQSTRTGLKLGQNRRGELIVLQVDEKGLFFGELQVGQRIISVHGNPPEDDGHTKDLMQKMKNGTRNFVETIKQKTKGNNTVDSNENTKGKDRVTEAMKTLRDSKGKLLLFVQTTRVRKEDVKYAEWKNEYDRVLRQKTIFKVIVAFSLFVLFITATVLVSSGVNGLESAIDTGVETISIVEGKMREGVQFLDDALELNPLINNEINSLLVSLNGICPARTDKICSNLNDPNSCQSVNGLSIVSEMQQAITYTQNDNSHEQVIQEARTAVDDITMKTANIVDTNLDPVDRALAGALAFGIIVIVISILLLLVLFIPMPETIRCALFFLSYGGLFIIILSSFLLVLVVLAVTSAVGDVCYDDPGSKIENILRTDISTSDQIQDMVFNILNGCSAPEARLDENLNFQTEGIDLFENFDSAIDQLKQTTAICGTPPNSIVLVETALNNINLRLCEAFNILTKFSDFFTCRFWHPIYAQAAHESLCYQGLDALSAITNTLFVILCMSLLIMTFRVALWDAVRPPSRQEASDSKYEKIEDNEKLLETQSKDLDDEFASVENLPAKKKKKKKKRKSKYIAPEEGMDEKDTTHSEWEDEPEKQGDEGETPADVDDEMPNKKIVKKKKGPKKKKKKKKKAPLHDGEGLANEDAAVESVFADGDKTKRKKKKKKRKKKKVHIEAVGHHEAQEDDMVSEDEIVG